MTPNKPRPRPAKKVPAKKPVAQEPQAESQAKHPQGDITSAIFEFQSNFKGLEKIRVNSFTNSTYASLDDVMNDAQPLLTKLKLAVFYVSNVHGKPDGSGFQTVLTCRILHIPSNTVMESSFLLPDIDAGAQVVGSYMTFWRRYLFCGMTNIVETGDDDGNATMPMTTEVPRITEKQHSQILDWAEATSTVIGEANDAGVFPDGTLMHHIQTTMKVESIEQLSTRQATVIIKMLETKHKRLQKAAEVAEGTK